MCVCVCVCVFGGGGGGYDVRMSIEVSCQLSIEYKDLFKSHQSALHCTQYTCTCVHSSYCERVL